MILFLFAGWTPEQVKTWICSFFGESVGQKFVEEEIDGKALLSKRLEEDTTLEKLGVTTIGKKERFSRELMAIKPVVNGKYSSLAKFRKPHVISELSILFYCFFSRYLPPFW